MMYAAHLIVKRIIEKSSSFMTRRHELPKLFRKIYGVKRANVAELVCICVIMLCNTFPIATLFIFFLTLSYGCIIKLCGCYLLLFWSTIIIMDLNIIFHREIAKSKRVNSNQTYLQ